ncbi:DUF4326 domain-containing protein [Vibrio gallaecicus]|uniref:DUF4326 domain-containing protein n=1 Tax=Vibrio gallaecicus TaxID=552386 RepID=UPI0010C9A116|nr:DUF4326 domain-containing protein [Vibrio gallaecicus]MDN3616762.1 DUF4326 domain-containing protein [Vibrio gallaecicus]
MNKLLILCPKEFNCFSKFKRKLDRITSNMQSVELLTTRDDNGLLKQYAESIHTSLEVQDVMLETPSFTHAVIFDDGEVFQSEIEMITSQGIPLRVIKIAVTRVVNIKNDTEYADEKSTNNYEYIGRGSYWGNPHSMFEAMEDSDEDPREAVIRMYKYDFDYDKFLNIDKSKVYELAGKRLGCFCKPQSCHGDVLADYLNQWDDGK